MAKTKLDALALGYSGALIAAVIMFLLSLLAMGGMYMGAASQMQKWHMFYSLSIGGTITGIIEAAVISFVFMYLFGVFYNKFAR